MKSFFFVIGFVLFVSGVFAEEVESTKLEEDELKQADLVPANQASLDDEEELARFKKFVYTPVYPVAAGSAPSKAYANPPPQVYSYPSPAPQMPCAKNLLLSCTPSLVPVPCGAPPAAPAYGPVGAYSEPVAAYYPYY